MVNVRKHLKASPEAVETLCGDAITVKIKTVKASRRVLKTYKGKLCKDCVKVWEECGG